MSKNTMNTVKRNSSSKSGRDFFETQDSTIDILLKSYYKDKLNDNSIICDFSCGNGVILDRFKRYNNNIETFGSDIIINEKYLSQDMFTINENHEVFKSNKDVHIIMNPPFNKLEEVLDHFLQLKHICPQIKSISLLHSLRSLEGKRRYLIQEKYSFPSLIINMIKRQKFNTYFEDNKYSEWTPPFSCVWSIWDNNKNETKMIYIDK